MSADIIESLCGVHICVVHINNFSERSRPRDMLFLLKDTLSIEDEKLFKACISFVSHLFPRAIIIERTLAQIVKISTLYHNFLIDYCRDFSLILHICTRPQVALMCDYQALIFLNY